MSSCAHDDRSRAPGQNVRARLFAIFARVVAVRPEGILKPPVDPHFRSRPVTARIRCTCADAVTSRRSDGIALADPLAGLAV